jgi:type I restriction enzyme M protein
MEEKMQAAGSAKYAPLKLYGQEYTPSTWAMSKMNMVIHDMEGNIEIGDTLKTPKFRDGKKLRLFDRVIANPMWNQSKASLAYINDEFFIDDEMERFPAGSCGGKIDWGWVQHILSSLNDNGRAAIVLDTGAASRGSGNQGTNKEKDCRKWFVDNDLVEGVIYLPENLFYNTTAPGIVIFLNKAKQNKNKIYLLHAGKEFEKGDPKNYIPDCGISKIVTYYSQFKEKEKFSRLVDSSEIIKNDYNISPSRYIHITDAETYRPLSEIVDELRSLEEDSDEIDSELNNILRAMGI